MPNGKPAWMKANGRPTMPPPMMVEMRLRAASTTVIACSSSPEAAALCFLESYAKKDAVIFSLVIEGTPPDAAFATLSYALLIGLF